MSVPSFLSIGHDKVQIVLGWSNNVMVLTVTLLELVLIADTVP